MANIKKTILFLGTLMTTLTACAQRMTDRIKLNQVGFYPAANKIAVVTGSTDASSFYIASTNLSDTLFKGKLSEEKASKNSTTITKIADFSALKTKGSYVVLVPGIGHSYIFEIGNNIYHNVAVASLKGYYYQRVSMPLEERYAGKWHRSAGHPDDVVYVHPSAATKERPAGTIISSAGGWYDAGDYNKYIVNSGVTMGTLLSAYEDFPAYFKTLKTNIPESGDGVPDILNEVIYNLRWMLTMQDPNDGGVYNKCTSAAFDGMVMPGVTKAPRYVVQKGTAATLDFAAVTAQASRILKSFEKELPGLADSCIKASTKAWQWALRNPALEYNQNKVNQTSDPGITTGGYGDRNFDDEWLWAGAELFITTKEKGYYDVVDKQVKSTFIIPSWANVAGLGYYSLLRCKSVLPTSTHPLIDKMKDQLLTLCNNLISNVGSSAFGTIMGQTRRDYSWGGNSTAANQSIALINAYKQTGDKKYLENSLSNLDYILGRNATGYCFVTGIGSKSTMHPHHRQSVADGVTEPVPGLLAGGPNPSQQDKCKYEFNEPETSYVDSDCSYASNEIAINWNAPLVYLTNAIEKLQKELQVAK
jgi:endoglucanase